MYSPLCFMCRLHVQKTATLNQFLIQYNCQISFTFISSRALDKKLKKIEEKNPEKLNVFVLRFSSFFNGSLSFFTHAHTLTCLNSVHCLHIRMGFLIKACTHALLCYHLSLLFVCVFDFWFSLLKN